MRSADKPDISSNCNYHKLISILPWRLSIVAFYDLIGMSETAMRACGSLAPARSNSRINASFMTLPCWKPCPGVDPVELFDRVLRW
jgi:hypothetical protein